MEFSLTNNTFNIYTLRDSEIKLHYTKPRNHPGICARRTLKWDLFADFGQKRKVGFRGTRARNSVNQGKHTRAIKCM